MLLGAFTKKRSSSEELKKIDDVFVQSMSQQRLPSYCEVISLLAILD